MSRLAASHQARVPGSAYSSLLALTFPVFLSAIPMTVPPCSPPRRRPDGDRKLAATLPSPVVSALGEGDLGPRANSGGSWTRSRNATVLAGLAHTTGGRRADSRADPEGRFCEEFRPGPAGAHGSSHPGHCFLLAIRMGVCVQVASDSALKGYRTLFLFPLILSVCSLLVYVHRACSP